MKDQILDRVKEIAQELGIEVADLHLEYPEDPGNGDFSSNIALASAKKLGQSPKALAETIVSEFKKKSPEVIKDIKIAGPGFINFFVKEEFFAEQVKNISRESTAYGKTEEKKGKQVMIEYTDPNPFKIFHIGHLMANAIGESLSRLYEYSGAQVIRANYQGDVGLHVAKTIWAIRKTKEESGIKNQEEIVGAKSLTEKVAWLGEMYVYGSQFEENAVIQKEIADVNKKIFDKSDPEINTLYEQGRAWSLEYFETIYKKLGTHFDQMFFESEIADDGLKIVREFLKKGVFRESEGAVVFPGEEHGLHTRVFITSNGLPTYETKELGLNNRKFEIYEKLDESIIVTANEQNDYFRVLLKVLSLVSPKIAEKTKHVSHGILRFASGKMSSRKGNIIPAESLLTDIKNLVLEKIAGRNFNPEETEKISNEVAISAIKYTILRSAIGSDIIFDSAASISFEGDSGPYLQYAVVRAKSVLEKAGAETGKNSGEIKTPPIIGELEKLLCRFPDLVEYSRYELAPQHIANYLVQLAGSFNAFYAKQIIFDPKDPFSPYYLALTQAFVRTMESGLYVIGISVPAKM
jgi:arginyl-tRNA synthetase